MTDHPDWPARIRDLRLKKSTEVAELRRQRVDEDRPVRLGT